MWDSGSRMVFKVRGVGKGVSDGRRDIDGKKECGCVFSRWEKDTVLLQCF